MVVVWALVITLPGASEPKAQMVAPGGRVGATFPVTPEVAQRSQRSFEPAPMEVTCLGLLLEGWRLVAQAWSHRGVWLGPAQEEVAGLSLLWWRLW